MRENGSEPLNENMNSMNALQNNLEDNTRPTAKFTPTNLGIAARTGTVDYGKTVPQNRLDFLKNNMRIDSRIESTNNDDLQSRYELTSDIMDIPQSEAGMLSGTHSQFTNKFKIGNEEEARRFSYITSNLKGFNTSGISGLNTPMDK